MIIKDENKLKIKCEPCNSVEEGEQIGAQLLEILTRSKNGIGLAANQIGINKRVCVLNVKEPVVLVNPKIVEKSDEQFAFAEACLSFPGKSITTIRQKWVKVVADNHPGILYFTIWDGDEIKNEGEKIDYALECACVQHEIDHLDGITMFDRKLKQEPIKRAIPKIGRNEKVTITDGNETKVIKWKKAEPMLTEGWKLSDIQINTYD
tara:strand:- start:765 stop:1385 length:621 start_codon:yes stop_codon:yes gene_type:complete